MAHQVQDFEIHAGDDLVITVKVTDDGTATGNAVDISALTAITWAAEDADSGARALTKTLGAGIAILGDSANPGEFTVTLTDDDTRALSGWYRHEARITDENGLKSTVLTGMMEVHPTIMTASE